MDSQTYPAIVLNKMTVFPTEKISLVLAGEEIVEIVARAHQKDHKVALIFEDGNQKGQIGVIAQISQHWELASNIIGLIVEGLHRVRITKEFFDKNVRMVEVEDIKAEEMRVSQQEKIDIEALSRNVLEQFKRLAQTEGLVPLFVIEDLQKEYLPPDRVSDIVASVLKISYEEKRELLETLDIRKRLEILNSKLINELNIAQTEKKIQQNVEKEIEQTQKEYILRERLKEIEKELGIFEEQKEYKDLERKIRTAGLPKDSEERVLQELYRLKRMPAGSAEVPYIRTYLDWITELPWSKTTQTTVDLKHAKEVLDEDHYGLDKAKERVLEYLAVQKLTGGKGRGTILCFVGPPGTGKTSVGQSIARALGRKFVRISLGGIRDEAEIRGHRRTYVGALPGRIIQGIRNAGSKNPVFMLDEIDKLGADFRGDPSAALLEALDPAQNYTYSDHYIEIPFDLSEVFFITTANILDPIPPALRDRMEVIEFPGYTDDEKFHIAKRHLLPRIISTNGLSQTQFKITDGAIRKIITRYTQEAGVRELERKLSEIARKIAKQEAEREEMVAVVISEEDIIKYLGPEEFEVTVAEKEDEVGVATGLAWTPAGGEIIFIEVTLVPGKGNLTLTGQLGDVMQESARAALTYVRSRAKQLGFDSNFYYKSDIHIHVPSGAIPKDGPSSGVAIAAALASALTKRKIKKDISLTGEITLSGKVLKVGGIKEKVLAAHRGGVKAVIMPQDNTKNLVDVPCQVRKELKFLFVDHMDQALDMALG